MDRIVQTYFDIGTYWIPAQDGNLDAFHLYQRHYTYVNGAKIKSVNPGYCFKMAGWRECGKTKGGLTILERLFL